MDTDSFRPVGADVVAAQFMGRLLLVKEAIQKSPGRTTSAKDTTELIEVLEQTGHRMDVLKLLERQKTTMIQT